MNENAGKLSNIRLISKLESPAQRDINLVSDLSAVFMVPIIQILGQSVLFHGKVTWSSSMTRPFGRLRNVMSSPNPRNVAAIDFIMISTIFSLGD